MHKDIKSYQKPFQPSYDELPTKECYQTKDLKEFNTLEDAELWQQSLDLASRNLIAIDGESIYWASDHKECELLDKYFKGTYDLGYKGVFPIVRPNTYYIIELAYTDGDVYIIELTKESISSRIKDAFNTWNQWKELYNSAS